MEIWPLFERTKARRSERSVWWSLGGQSVVESKRYLSTDNFLCSFGSNSLEAMELASAEHLLWRPKQSIVLSKW